MVRSAIPILYSGDLAVSEVFYASLGFEVTARFEGYLVTNAGAVEVHLSAPDPGTDPGRDRGADPDTESDTESAVAPATDGSGLPSGAGTCFVHVRDAIEYHNQLAERGVPRLSAPQEQAYGLTEFDVLDPYGNRIRFGSPPTDRTPRHPCPGCSPDALTLRDIP
jgi:catechol 2,3-dioxygenase-like lactoylglutathione lyase family enzyme